MKREHYFNIVLSSAAKGSLSQIVKSEERFVNSVMLADAQKAAFFATDAVILGVNYLGYMTENEWSTNEWQKTNKAAPRQLTSFVKGFVTSCLLLCAVLAVTTFLRAL
jgi:hypothetical protein